MLPGFMNTGHMARFDPINVRSNSGGTDFEDGILRTDLDRTLGGVIGTYTGYTIIG